MSYVPITYVRLDRVTAQQMNYIQTQYRNCEMIRTVDVLPAVIDSSEGEILFLTTDKKFYGFNGTEWETIGDVKLPISDENNLLYNHDVGWKTARFDLSRLTQPTPRVYYLPDVDGTFALLSNVPVITGDTDRSLLFRGADNYTIESNGDILIGRTATQPYIEINKDTLHTADIIKYNESINNAKFVVRTDGHTLVKRLTLFSGADG